VLTDYAAPEAAILEGLRIAAGRAGVSLQDIGQVIHGTTLVTNALIERRGARMAFVTTEGFRDVIEMRSENRFEQYDLNLRLPEPLVPREHRLTVAERMSPEGEVLLALSEAEVARVVAQVVAGGYEAVAVGFLHSYANDAHERMVGEALRRALPGLSVSLSSVVSPQMRELPRFNTVCANAYVQPQVADYLGRLVARLRAEGIGRRCSSSIRAAGSCRSRRRWSSRCGFWNPARRAARSSRPATRGRMASRKALSFDMGGTTAKICLVEDGAPKTANSFEIARTYRFKKGSGMVVSTPVVEMVEIGAGGGSIASIDAMGRIQVGPRSAGSEPGPACYRRGGENPTVTDANLILGRIDAESFAGGAIPLEAALAERAVETRLGALGLSTGEAAFGVTEMVDENMANAARVHAVENGRDIEAFTMIAFGGGAPLHACRLAEKLGTRRLIVPPGAGVGSAIGFLRAPFSYEATRGLFQRLDAFDAGAVNAALAQMREEAAGFVARGAGDRATEVRLTAFMRYSGQGWEIAVPLDWRVFSAEDVPAIRAAFEAAYTRLFGRVVERLAVEITNWSLVVATRAPEVARVAVRTHGAEAPVVRERAFFDAALRREVAAKEVRREEFRARGCRRRAGGDRGGGDLDHRHLGLPGGGAGGRGDPDPAEGGAMSIDHQIMWNRLIAVVEEQATTLIRTAFSTSVREAGDLSAGLFDRQARMIAQAVTGTPGHVNAMAESVGHFAREIGAQNIHEGDVYVTNDPWMGTGHLHDITMVTPVFRKGVHIGFFACTAHVVDIGGRGFGPDAGEVFEEGLLIPIAKFAERGRVDPLLIRLIRANVRTPDQTVGDMYSLAACNEAGNRRLQAMLDEFGVDDIDALSDFIIDASARATRAAIARVPDGTYRNEMRVDGYDAPVEMRVRLDVSGERLVCDFAGTSGESPKGVNVPEVYTRAYACYGLKVAIAPEVPNNAGSLAPFEITAPEGSHPRGAPPRAGLGPACAGPSRAGRGAGRAASGAAGRGAGGRRVLALEHPDQRAGVRPRKPPAARRDPDVQLGRNRGAAGGGRAFGHGLPLGRLDHERRGDRACGADHGLAEGAPAGLGRGRADARGLGQVIEIAPRRGYDMWFNAMFDRVENPARGRDGGGAGAPGRVELADGTRLRSKGRQRVAAGQRLRLSLPGGGGIGNPRERDREAVRRDVAAGYISAEEARERYGWEGD
jgi:5-oxoprolinase (ATP-hydrolysing)